MPHSLAPLRHPGFAPFLSAQLLGAFNDNVFKNALVLYLSSAGASAFGLSPALLIPLATAAFILPFFLFSATAGELADAREKSGMLRTVKLAEVGIMAAGAAAFAVGDVRALLVVLFAMGAQSAFVGPLKYSALPQLCGPEGLVAANALMETGTFLAILLGTLTGAGLVLLPHGPLLIGPLTIVTALLGYLASRGVPGLPAASQSSPRRPKNPLASTLGTLRILREERSVFLAAVGISFFWLFGAVMLSLFPLYARETLHAHEAVVTLFLTCFCVGTAVGSMLTERFSGDRLELGLVPLGSIGMTLFTLDLFFASASAAPAASGVALPLASVSEFLARPGSIRVLADLFGLSVFGGFFTVPLYTVLQERAKPARRSRVIAANNILNALFMVVGAGALAALLALGSSPAGVFLFLTALCLVCSVYLYALLPEFLLRFAAFLVARVLYRIEVVGHERIPAAGPVILVANHVSFVDWLVIGGSIRRPPRFVMDHRIASIPVVSRLFRDAKTIPIASAREDAELMERAFARIAEELRDDQVVCIFPEGKLTHDGEMDRFRSGIERIVRETPAPVVPMGLHGLWGSVFSRRGGRALGRLPSRFRARIRLTIGEPLPAPEVSAVRLESEVRELLPSGGTTPAPTR